MPKETIADILAEMRDGRIVRLDDADATRCLLRNLADRIEEAVQRFVADDCAKCAHYHAATISLKDALDLANTIANHGINANDLGDKASAAIYALCHEVRTVRREDAEIKQEVQRLRRDRASAPSNAALLRAALKDVLDHAPFATDHATMLTGGNDLLARLRHAYYAPARNCDRFQTLDEAREAFQKLRGHKVWADVELWDSMDEAGAFVRWLFSQTEKGGPK